MVGFWLVKDLIAAGARVNLEVDQVARYIVRLLEPYGGLPRMPI